ncbi:MAG TPA: ATP-binding protein [Steroidobacteraceae bacterium]|jgi:signal transduction histidine kinase
MDYKVGRPRRFLLAVALRAVLVGAFAFIVLQLITYTQLYATALFIAALAALVVGDLAQLIGRAERAAELDFERLAVEGSDVAVRRQAPSADSVAPFERAASILNAARAERQQHLDYLQTLLDTVASALIVLAPDGRATLANRAARLLAGASVNRLEEIPVIGVAGAQRLLALAPGARQIVALADGRQMFVSVSQFVTPGHEPQRLMSLQRIAGELDAVELKAWQSMVDVLAHEMMNSLTPISSLSESLESLLRTGAPVSASDEVAGALEAIKRRSLGLMDFVARYRRVAELPAPKMQAVPMTAFLSGIERLIAPALRERGIAFSSRVEPGELTLRADPRLLEQAVINLLRNAADAVAGLEQPRIEVSCERQAGGGVLKISDNGCGVPEDRRDQIFVPFFTTKPGGSGIGLNLARQVALGHGGQLDVRANSPRGSVFTLILPAA